MASAGRRFGNLAEGGGMLRKDFLKPQRIVPRTGYEAQLIETFGRGPGSDLIRQNRRGQAGNDPATTLLAEIRSTLASIQQTTAEALK